MHKKNLTTVLSLLTLASFSAGVFANISVKAAPSNVNGSISGTVLFDMNNNQQKDAFESAYPAPNMVINMTCSDRLGGAPVYYTAVTDATGTYKFMNLFDGTCEISFLQTGGNTLVYDKTGDQTDGLISNQILTLNTTTGDVSSINDANFGFKDETPPVAPVITTPTANSVSAIATPTIKGTLPMIEAGATITVKEGTVTIGTAIVDAAGNWSLTPTTPLSQGSHSVIATAKDASGNVSAPSNTQTFTIDTNAAAAPTINTLPAITPANQTTYPVTGTCVAGNTVSVTVGTGTNAVTGTGVCATNGTFSIPLNVTGIPDAASVPVKANQTGPNGLPSADATTTVLKDTTAPVAPVITTPTQNQATVATPIISGTAEPMAIVKVTDDTGSIICTTIATSTGSWTCPANAVAYPGTHIITATQTDPAGNISPASAPTTFTVYYKQKAGIEYKEFVAGSNNVPGVWNTVYKTTQFNATGYVSFECDDVKTLADPTHLTIDSKPYYGVKEICQQVRTSAPAGSRIYYYTYQYKQVNSRTGVVKYYAYTYTTYLDANGNYLPWFNQNSKTNPNATGYDIYNASGVRIS